VNESGAPCTHSGSVPGLKRRIELQKSEQHDQVVNDTMSLQIHNDHAQEAVEAVGKFFVLFWWEMKVSLGASRVVGSP
jgi:hypothetical protein